MKYLYIISLLVCFGTPIFGQTDILELIPEHQRRLGGIKHIKELFQPDNNDNSKREPEISNEYWFDKQGKITKEIAFKKYLDRGDTLKTIYYYYKDTLLVKELIIDYLKYDLVVRKLEPRTQTL
ncbi:hypothetical protein [Plebeiibacterium sediminum]|uniref:Uncharacterized protein n=1 Tax=Plebeiibacterium sediminum TaxID=2992112 RepID=A0AAE3SH83_9BACT|nr:hypothetical protein [Plebeiobacterium sediminum]MCW3788927.1 hypothetical protein [Plebeiobacterium sediminum]